MDVRHWQKSFLKKLFPTLNSSRNGKIWSLRETFPFMKMLLLAVLKGGIKGFNKCNLLFIAPQNWNYFGVKWGVLWESATLNHSPSNKSAPERYFRTVF